MPYVKYVATISTGGLNSERNSHVDLVINQTGDALSTQSADNAETFTSFLGNFLLNTSYIRSVVATPVSFQNGRWKKSGIANKWPFSRPGGRTADTSNGGPHLAPDSICLKLVKKCNGIPNGAIILRGALEMGDLVAGNQGKQFSLLPATVTANDAFLGDLLSGITGTPVVLTSGRNAARTIVSMANGGIVDNQTTRHRSSINRALAKATERDVRSIWDRVQDLIDDYSSGGITYDIVAAAWAAANAESGGLINALPLAAKVLVNVTHPALPAPP